MAQFSRAILIWPSCLIRPSPLIWQGQMADELQRTEERWQERSRRGDVDMGSLEEGDWEGEPEDWRDASVLDRLKYDISRERRSSQVPHRFEAS